MRFDRLSISGAWSVELDRYADERGWFEEWFKFSRIDLETGMRFEPVQANVSRSSAGAVRGIHYSTAPKGQGKLVTVLTGAIDDYVVDIRPNSPTFMKWERIELSEDRPKAVLIDPHLGHAFQAKSENATVCYLVTAEYDPISELGISPLCSSLAISWDTSHSLLLSTKDSNAPTLYERLAQNQLPLQ